MSTTRASDPGSVAYVAANPRVRGESHFIAQLTFGHPAMHGAIGGIQQ